MPGLYAMAVKENIHPDSTAGNFSGEVPRCGLLPPPSLQCEQCHETATQ